MDLYCRLGTELRSLFTDLFDPRMEGVVRQKMAKILQLASQIGGIVEKEAVELNCDLLKFLEKPNDAKLLKIMKKHALHLEQETREL